MEDLSREFGGRDMNKDKELGSGGEGVKVD
jgi:hypothetical protein